MKLSFRECFAILAAKFALSLSPRSTSAPGLAALKIAPGLLNKLLSSSKAPIFITGTNGKSTTAGMLASIINEGDMNFIHNRSGANLPSGLLTELIKHLSCNLNCEAKLESQEILFEIDEAVLRKITEHNPAKLILVNNFFRDQLDRFGEMNQTINLVQEGIRFVNEANNKPSLDSQSLAMGKGLLVLNADDPNVCKLKYPEDTTDTRVLYFGIDAKVWKQNNLPDVYAEELGLCPRCNADLTYKIQWLGQFGDFVCDSCGYKRPDPAFKVTELKFTTCNSQIKLEFPNLKNINVKVPLPGLFNVYNALGSAAVAYSLGFSQEQIKNGIENYKSLFGRSQEVKYKDKSLKIFLIKNPIGASEVLRLIRSDPKAKVLLAINDNYADGRDVSWLWDAHFEHLVDNKFPVFATGTRGSDIAVRLKYAGVKRITYYEYLKQAIEEFCDKSSLEDNLYLVPTYTALLQITKLLKINL
ncbi:MAG: MurT ligase domain-containing protein [Candidatus Caenarcaniphilales bacterium]|nr:MurT ligase domain-containing protein [Candidatus Caenarcaniphilales bacterium]